MLTTIVSISVGILTSLLNVPELLTAILSNSMFPFNIVIVELGSALPSIRVLLLFNLISDGGIIVYNSVK